MIDHLKRYSTLYLSFAAVVFAAVLTHIFPIYFREDDVYYLRWAASYKSPISAFIPATAVMFGVFRPLQNIIWWVMFRVFGLDPTGYQFVTILLYLLSFLWLFEFMKRSFDLKTAVLSLFLYLACFNSFIYIMFWFSDLTFILELFFIYLALIFLCPLALKNRLYLIVGVFFFILAILSKEPACLIVPISAIFFHASKRVEVGRAAFRLNMAVSLGILLVGALVIMKTPSMDSRQESILANGFAEAFKFVAHRWSFYSAQLLRRYGFPIVGLLTYSFLGRPGFKPYIGKIPALILSFAMGIVAYLFPSFGMVVFVVMGLLMILRLGPEAIGISWFGLVFAGIMLLGFVTRTYLIEATFGLTIAGAFGLKLVLDDFVLNRLDRISMKTKIIAGAAIAIIVMIAGVFVLKDKTASLQMVSAQRQNFADVIEYIERNIPDGSTIIVIDYEDMGLGLNTDIAVLDDETQGRIRKTMNCKQVYTILKLAGKNLSVVNYSPSLGSYNGDTFVFTMNNNEVKFLKSENPDVVEVFSADRMGEGARLFRVPPKPALLVNENS